LPREIKEILWELPYTPDFDDLKDAWKLAEDQKGKEWLIRTLNCFEEERKIEDKRRADAKRAERAAERARKLSGKWQSRYERVYGLRKVDHSNDKHGRLVQLVKDEDAMKLMSQRKETREVKAATTYERVYLGTRKIDIQDRPTAQEEEDRRPAKVVHLCKALHNAGGKPS
jgi:hypothetical protein